MDVPAQAYLRTLAAHPVLQRSEEVGLFLGVPSELAQCSRWTQLLQRAVPGDALLGLLRHVDATHALQSGADATTPAGGGGGGGLGMMLRMKLLNAVGTHRPRVRLSPEEAQLRQIKALLRCVCDRLHVHVRVDSYAAACGMDEGMVGNTWSSTCVWASPPPCLPACLWAWSNCCATCLHPLTPPPGPPPHPHTPPSRSFDSSVPQGALPAPVWHCEQCARAHVK